MSFVPRGYEEIVRDLLTTLTGGTVRESLTVPPEGFEIALDKLRDRPVRRISHLQGTALVGMRDNQREIPYRFTAADFELVSEDGNGGGEGDLIRFRESGRRPVPGSTLTVNYYPVQTDPVPLTDLNVGSVARTLFETFARELALAYLNLETIYESAFLDTATGNALEKVVALVGVKRLAARHPVARVRFTRQAGTPGQITVPAGTAVVDAAGNRYLTVSGVTLEAYETTREVQAAGETATTAVVAAAALDRLEQVVAGVSQVTNPEPARQLSSPESDDELRRRARSALAGVDRGTLSALRFGLESIAGVNQVAIVERPAGVAGEVRIEVAFGDDSPEVRDEVARRIEELRPAGIRVLFGEAARREIQVRAALTLAGSSLPEAELTALRGDLEGRLEQYLTALAPGATARRAKLSALALEDDRIVDAQIALVAGGVESEELTLGDGEVLDVTAFEFPPPAFETAAEGPLAPAVVGAVLPLLLETGVSLAEARSAIEPAYAAHLDSRGPDATLDVDGLVAAIRDDSRFALVRADVLVTVESGGRFLQLTDGAGAYTPQAGEILIAGTIDIEDRTGA